MHLKKLQQTEIHLQLCSNTEITLLLQSSCKLIWRFISYIIRMGSGRKIKSLLQTFLCMLCYFCRGFWGKKTASARLYRRPAAVVMKTLNCSCLRFQTNDCIAIWNNFSQDPNVSFQSICNLTSRDHSNDVMTLHDLGEHVLVRFALEENSSIASRTILPWIKALAFLHGP